MANYGTVPFRGVGVGGGLVAHTLLPLRHPCYRCGCVLLRLSAQGTWQSGYKCKAFTASWKLGIENLYQKFPFNRSCNFGLSSARMIERWCGFLSVSDQAVALLPCR